MNGRISPHILISEVACKGGDRCCGGSFPIHPGIVEAFEELRALAGGRRIDISSGFRCIRHNMRQPGASRDSQHCLGRALDLRVPIGMTVDQFAALAEQVESLKHGGIGRYPWGIHIDVRADGPARWDSR